MTVDKPPASLWLMGLSVRLFGLSSWSILAPQALLGIAAVFITYLSVRRVLDRGLGVTQRSHWAGLFAGLALALTPVATLMFRFNNPDALLVALECLAAYFVVRAIEKAGWKWLVAAGVVIGFGFLTKMLQAFVVLPAFVAAYAIAAPTTIKRKLTHLLAAFGAMLAALGWYVAIVELVPASWRPYIGGSQNNSLLELVFGYNGLGRITGEQVGSVGGGGQGGGWGTTSVLRMFEGVSGGMVSWLIPAALVVLIGGLVLAGRGQRAAAQLATAQPVTAQRDPSLVRAAMAERGGLVIFGGWLVVTALVFSFMQGIYHDYYTVALAPAIGATAAIGFAVVWSARRLVAARLTMAVAVAVTAVWGWVLSSQAGGVYETIGHAAAVLGGVVAVVLLVVGQQLRRLAAAGAVLGVAAAAALAGPASYAVNTAATPHTGSIVTAGPVTNLGGSAGRMGGGPAAGRGVPGGGRPQTLPNTQNLPNQQPPGMTGQPPTGDGRTGFGNPGGGMNGLLNGANVSAELVAALQADAGNYTWAAASVGAQNAASYQLASGQPVMAIGGFNGSDPSPTLAQFQQYVAEGRIHYFLGGGGFGGQNGGSNAAGEIAAWVQQNFTAQTIGSTTVHDLTQAK
ncbi:glycosyltransferase family 39 protein [Propionibacteriaceae bacterium G57]|uniref:glycosyltransferase family 39 protein n=1 Tax=Aestuariimicrobium sp. G57 TaxID=3418485 RepID=UPI003DA76670